MVAVWRRIAARPSSFRPTSQRVDAERHGSRGGGPDASHTALPRPPLPCIRFSSARFVCGRSVGERPSPIRLTVILPHGRGGGNHSAVINAEDNSQPLRTKWQGNFGQGNCIGFPLPFPCPKFPCPFSSPSWRFRECDSGKVRSKPSVDGNRTGCQRSFSAAPGSADERPASPGRRPGRFHLFSAGSATPVHALVRRFRRWQT